MSNNILPQLIISREEYAKARDLLNKRRQETRNAEAAQQEAHTAYKEAWRKYAALREEWEQQP